DPNAPKKPVSAYLHYSSAVRPSLTKEFPTLKLGELSKKIGAQWKDLAPQEKAKYAEMQKADKERYEVEIKAYKALEKPSAAAAAAPAAVAAAAATNAPSPMPWNTPEAAEAEPEVNDSFAMEDAAADALAEEEQEEQEQAT
ncbi:hypothetical protein TrRE_jg34, partial [Triparma retinervis]